MKKPEYIRFKRVEAPTRKTQVWDIISIHSEQVLGRIAWFSSWRQYVLYPEANTCWNPGCLDQIKQKIQALNDEHRESLQRAKEGASR